MTSQYRDWGWRLFPGGLAAGLMAALVAIGVVQPLEDLAYRSLFRLRGTQRWDQRLVVVAIDDRSLAAVGQFPWSRQEYVRLMERLIPADPGVIAFNLIFSEPHWADQEFADRLAQHGRVVLAEALDTTGVPLRPVAPLDQAAIATGHILETTDSDGLVRQIQLTQANRPALGLAALQVYSLIGEPVMLPTASTLWLNWVGAAADLPTYSFIDVVTNQVPATVFQDKIVLVGVTATGFDTTLTPFDPNPPTSSVYLHATVLQNLLELSGLVTPPLGLWLGILLVGGPGLSAVLAMTSIRQQLVLIGGVCISWVLLSSLMLREGWLLPVAAPSLLFVTTTLASTLSDRLRENWTLQQQIQRLWDQYHADIVERHHSQPLVTQAPISPAHFPLSRPRHHGAQLAALAEQYGRSQSTQAVIARNLAIGILAADWDERVWFCNPVATTLLNLRLGDQLGDRLAPIWLSSADWQAMVQALQAGGQGLEQEVQYGDRWYLIRLDPLRYRLHSDPHAIACPDGLLLMLEDTTRRKQIEVNLNRQIEELRQLSLLKDDFLSTVSHELRAPMANIKMAIRMLEIATEPARRQRYLAILQRECDRETTLIDDLLDLQRLESGAKELKAEAIELEEWLHRLVEPFQTRAASRQQRLYLHVEANLPTLWSDRASLDRAVGELLNNACKYTPPEASIAVMAQWTAPHIDLIVQNTGSEIPETELPRIFDKFYRVPSGDRWQQGGTGLGLALVKRLVETLQGHIEVASGNQLTTFSIHLPPQALALRATVEVATE